MQRIQFAYFKGTEAEQYSFYRVPKVLFTESCFQSLSCEAKVLYGLMLDRMGLSVKNRWMDDQGRAYIIFRVEEVMELLGCGRQKAVKSIAELDTEKGIGLIEKKRLGLGRPNVIYVKHILFTEDDIQEELDDESVSYGDFQKDENQTLGKMKNGLLEVPVFPEDETGTSEGMKIILQEVPKSSFQGAVNYTPGRMKMELQEVRKANGNKTDFKKTEMNEKDKNETEPILSIPSGEAGTGRRKDGIDEIAHCRQVIRENIGYGQFTQTGYDRQIVDELVELMAEVMGMPDSAYIRISGVDRPVAAVKRRLLMLDHAHMEYVLLCLRQNRTKVGNIRAYLLTALYNAPITISNYYQAEANHDLYEGILGGKT